MKNVLIIIAVIALFLTSTGIALADSGPLGPNPDAGDGIPDGSSLDSPNGPNGDMGLWYGSVGPAPNSGDGIPDGSGF